VAPVIVRVGIVDDHPLVIGGLDEALSSVKDIRVVARGGSVAEARTILARADVDVLLLDIRLPDGNGLVLLSATANERRCPVLVLSSFETPQYVSTALRFGARGFMLKTVPLEELVAAIRAVAGGGSAFTAQQLLDANARSIQLSGRERQIVRLVVGGRSNEEIAGEIGTSRKTVEAHLTHLYGRLGIASRVELALRAERDGWLEVGASSDPGEKPRTVSGR
jgi:DNA-binding NarL/FixJ family response regulator